MPSIKGTASVADARERSKALKSTRFPTNFTTKVKLDKVNKPVMAQWIEQKVTSILGFEDEIVSSTATNLFLPSDGSIPDPRRAQLDLVGFLGESESAAFASELWTLLVEAQSSPSGIPRTILEAKKQELAQQRQQREARRPEIHRFVEEANRRAAAARNMVPPAESIPAPVSPTHPSDHPPPPSRDDRGQASRYDRKRKSSRSPDSGERKLPATRRMDRPPMPPMEDGYYRDSRRGDGGRSSHHSSRDRNRNMEYAPPPPPRYGGPTGGGEDEFRRTNDWRRDDQGLPPPPHPPPPHARHADDRGRRPGDNSYDRRRYHSDQEEMEDLERRLSMLKKRFVKRGDDYALDDEIEDIEDRLYDLERRQRRRRREEETRRRPRSRERRPPPPSSSSSRPQSPPSSSQPAQSNQSRRSPARRHRGRSSSRSRSPSSDSRSSRSSASSRSSSRSASRSRSSYDSRDRRRGRRSRSVSSGGSSSSRSSDDTGSRRSR